MLSLNKVLLTGGTGFVGRAVQRRWKDCVLWPRGVDLSDQDQVREALELLLPQGFEAVLHLAAQASPSRSLEEPVRTWAVNLMGTVHLLETLLSAGWKGRFLFVSTGAVYGGVTGKISEESPLVIDSPYVASKLAAESAVLEWALRSGLHANIVRPFNHSGPGQSVHYFLPSMAQQLASLGPSGGEIEVGNLRVQRDFLHVDDVVDAYRAILEKGKPSQIYNLAGGRSVSLSEILDEMIVLSGRQVSLRESRERFRPGCEAPIEVDTARLRNDTGWTKSYGLDLLLRDLLKEWMD